MKVNFMTQLAVIAALFTSSTEGNIFKDGQCCLSCTEPKEKYYSVDKIHNMCGEACMDPKDYWLYKLFDKISILFISLFGKNMSVITVNPSSVNNSTLVLSTIR